MNGDWLAIIAASKLVLPEMPMQQIAQLNEAAAERLDLLREQGSGARAFTFNLKSSVESTAVVYCTESHAFFIILSSPVE
ncbi:MAG: hypothetical protein GY815_01025 [Gammaproteobacteria bacterium]|nr:hypothetical protein [Gammaproteobacteria bacterium]